MHPQFDRQNDGPKVPQVDPTVQSPFVRDLHEQQLHEDARAGYLAFTGKAAKPIFMRSSLDLKNGVELDPSCPFERVIYHLMDEPVVQRMRHINQIACANWVYPDAVQSRRGHILGCAYLTAEVLSKLNQRAAPEIRGQIMEWGPVVVAFGLTHDLGHIAPGSHLAQKVWFPNEKDCHEEVSHHILEKDIAFRQKLEQIVGPGAADKLDRVTREDPSVPEWTWRLITGGGWNTDRGDWVPRDSQFCGVTYGYCDPKLIIKHLVITPDGQLAIGEGGVSTLESFFRSRSHMYGDVYYHGTSRIGERMHELVGQRARELLASGQLHFCDDTMEAVLSAPSVKNLSLENILNMTDMWWGYHIHKWSSEPDITLQKLAKSILLREPFKKFPSDDYHRNLIGKLVEGSGLDKRYFYFELPPAPIRFKKDLDSAMPVQKRDGSLVPLTQHSRELGALATLESVKKDGLIAAPLDIWRDFRPA